MSRVVKWLHVGDVGAEIFLMTHSDMSGAGQLDVRVKRPDGTADTLTPGVANTRTIDGVDVQGISYFTKADDLDQDGDWEVQPGIANLNGFTGVGLQVRLVVKPALPGS